MATPRETIAAQFRTDHTGWDVYDFPYEPSELRKPTAVVYRSTLAPVANGLDHELTCQLYGLKSLGAASEAELDTLLDGVMLSLQRLDLVRVKSATRKTFGDVFQGWELELGWTSSDIYKTQIMNEG